MKDLIKAELNKGITQRDLAKRIGFSHGTIQKILFTDTKFRYETRKLVADYFRIPVAQLYDNETEAIPSAPYPKPSPPDDLLAHAVKMQDIRIAQMQVVIDEMNRNIKAVHEEIGRMKDKMMDASTSGDIHRLNPIIQTRN